MGERIDLVKRAFAGEAVERIPVMAHNFLMAVREAGFTQKQFRESPDVMVKAMTEATMKYDLDCVLLDVDTALLATQGVTSRAEDVQSNGRADVVAKHKRGIYIFELKVDEPVDKAFAQIRKKGYAEPYLADGRPIWLIGLSFDSKTRRLVDYAAERFDGSN